MEFSKEDFVNFKKIRKKRRRLIIRLCKEKIIFKKDILSEPNYILPEEKVKEINEEVALILYNDGYDVTSYNVEYRSRNKSNNISRSYVNINTNEIVVGAQEVAFFSIITGISLEEVYKCTLLHEIGHIFGSKTKKRFCNECFAWAFANKIYTNCNKDLIRLSLYSYYPITKKVKLTINAIISLKTYF